MVLPLAAIGPSIAGAQGALAATGGGGAAAAGGAGGATSALSGLGGGGGGGGGDSQSGAAVGAGLGGAIAGIINLLRDDDAGERELEAALRAIQSVGDPAFDFSTLTPPVLRLIAKLDPVTFQAQIPPEVQQIALSDVRPDQIRALQGLQIIATQGQTPAEKLAAQQAIDQIAGESQRATEALVRELGARGRLGGGVEARLRIAGGEAAQGLAGELGRDLARQALERRFGALQAGGQLAGQIRGQDFQRGVANQQALQRFNEFVARQRQEAARFGAESRQRAQERNVGEAQRIAEANELLRAQTERENIERQNRLQQALRDFQLRRAGGEAGAFGDLGEFEQFREAAKRRNIRSIGEGLGGVLGTVGGSFFGGGGR